MKRSRMNCEPRRIVMVPNYIEAAMGSCLVELGNTRVICTAMIEDKVPSFKKGTGSGWLTCEYSMLPASTRVRKTRDINKLKLDGRSAEIQRLIGRSLRSCVDFEAIGERTVWIDCDVINADGGTRTAAINGSFIALCLALSKLKELREIDVFPIVTQVAAISAGLVNDEILIDLDYSEDSNADVDLNLVENSRGEIVELQCSAEHKTLSKNDLFSIIDCAQDTIDKIFNYQKSVLKEELSCDDYDSIFDK